MNTNDIKIESANDIKNELKALIYSSGSTLQDINDALVKLKGVESTPQNFSNKLSKGSLKYSDVKLIARLCGYEIEWKKI